MPYVPPKPSSAVAHRGAGGRREGAYGASTAASPESQGRIPVRGSATERPDLDGAATHTAEGRREVSRRGESHPPPLSGPDVTVSRHPAPTVRREVTATSFQWANRSGAYR